MKTLLFIVLLPMFSEAKINNYELFQLLRFQTQETFARDALMNIVDTFKTYAKDGGKKLTKTEFLNLITEQFPGVAVRVKLECVLQRIFKEADQNRDNEVDWSEYVDILFLLGSYLLEEHEL